LRDPLSAGCRRGKGPIPCQAHPAREWTVARELLPKAPSTVKLPRPDSLPPELRSVTDAWWGTLEPSGEVVSFAIVDVDGVGRRAMFASFSGWRRGGLYEFTAADGEVKFKLADRGTVTLSGDTLTWAPATGAETQTAKLLRIRDQK